MAFVGPGRFVVALGVWNRGHVGRRVYLVDTRSGNCRLLDTVNSPFAADIFGQATHRSVFLWPGESAVGVLDIGGAFKIDLPK
jgi:hypothetical protein